MRIKITHPRKQTNQQQISGLQPLCQQCKCAVMMMAFVSPCINREQACQWPVLSVMKDECETQSIEVDCEYTLQQRSRWPLYKRSNTTHHLYKPDKSFHRTTLLVYYSVTFTLLRVLAKQSTRRCLGPKSGKRSHPFRLFVVSLDFCPFHCR